MAKECARLAGGRMASQVLNPWSHGLMANVTNSAEAARSERIVTVRVPGPLYDRIQRSAETQPCSF